MDKPKQRRGFATWTPEKRAEVSRLGGAAVPADRRSFSQDPALASSAGRLGGKVSRGGPKKRVKP